MAANNFILSWVNVWLAKIISWGVQVILQGPFLFEESDRADFVYVKFSPSDTKYKQPLETQHWPDYRIQTFIKANICLDPVLY